MDCGICKIIMLPDQQLCLSFVNQIRLTWPGFWVNSMPGIPQLELYYPHSRLLTELVPAWNGTVLMDCSDNVILMLVPGSEIIQNKSWLLKCHMAHAWCVELLKVSQWGITLFHHSITQEVAKFTSSFWIKLKLIVCTLMVFIQSKTSSGNTLSALSIGFGSLMNCISCSWIQSRTGCTGCSNTQKLEM